MSVSFKFWDDCVDPEDMQLMWKDANVSKEWHDANEEIGQKVHLSRDPDGQTYLTQTEMRAVARITVERHFKSQIEPEMICALAEILSDRQLLREQYDKKLNATKVGIMQILPSTAEWLVREMGYSHYNIGENQDILYRPFENTYFGAAYIKWLSSHDGKERSEEYVVRAYKGGIKKATHKSTVDYFQRYLFAKSSLPTDTSLLGNATNDLTPDSLSIDPPAAGKAGDDTIWDSRVSQVDMDDMWRNLDVCKEWTQFSEKRGRVRFSLDAEKKPYLSRVEVLLVLAVLAEVCSMRFVNGIRSRTGIMGIDYPTAVWLYRDIGARDYKVKSVDDLYNPFVSMYFGAAYLAWLSEYEGRARTHQFVVQAYLGGPENVNLQETGQHWKKFQETLGYFQNPKKASGSCCIM